ncbi:cytochrome b/b6 domain-containing protein [Profundibacter sp.]
MFSINTTNTYGSVTKTLHWLTALLILTAFPLGILANNAGFGTGEEIAQKAWLFSLHKTVGVTVFFTALARILWAITQKKPRPLHPDNTLEVFAAEAVHWLLYISMLMVPLSGWLHHAASVGFAPILWPFGQSLPLVPKSEAVSALFSGGHFVFTKLLLAAIALHIAGALKHLVIDKDQTLQRMLPGLAKIAPLPAQPHSKKPILAAIAVYAVAMTLGAWIGLASHGDHEHDKLAEVSSDWVVTEGTLAITLSQFGNDITGTFTDWRAAISFDPKTGSGHADVTINIASLTLGSLSTQALGADFFDAAAHPTAKFTAEITPNGDDYDASGSLTIKGVERPVTLPFTLEITEGSAVMKADVTLSRLDFGIGANMPDEASLKFPVRVSIELTASQSDT